ncbi:MAG TPA: helix-turn-helix domain-containing protein [Streptosporangiaceae bacterium]
MSGSTALAVVDEFAWHVPPPALRPFAFGYSGFRQAGVEPVRHRGLPSPYLTLIFTLDEPLMLAAHPDPQQPPGSFETLAGGLHTRPALIVHDGWQSGIQLMLDPLSARGILGLPAGELAGIDVDATAVLGPLAAQIQDRLREAATWAERFAILDQVLLARVGPRAARAAGHADFGVSSEVRYAWRALQRSGGNASVAAITAETGWSERYLRARFQAETGLAPKAAARVIRFDRAKTALRKRASARRGSGDPNRPACAGGLGLADLAAEHGYFDQAHLDREFRLLAGCPPTTWLAEESRNIQASPLAEPRS